MILIGLGGNLSSAAFGPPQQTLTAALRALAGPEFRIVARSRWFRTAPVPASDQPWFVNGVALVETTMSPERLLAYLLATEDAFGRTRGVANAPRVLDLDLLDYDALVSRPGAVPILPHPRLHERAFVLEPLSDVAPRWRHPVSGLDLAALIAALPQDQVAEPLDEA